MCVCVCVCVRVGIFYMGVIVSVDSLWRNIFLDISIHVCGSFFANAVEKGNNLSVYILTICCYCNLTKDHWMKSNYNGSW